MKKLILPLLIAIFLVTGCGGGSQVVKCTMSQDSTGAKMSSSVNVGIKNSKFDYIKMEIDVVVDDAYKAYKDMLVSSLESQFEGFESQYGAKVSIKDTEDGAKVTISMNSDEAEKFYGKDSEKLTKKKVIDEFESQGYTCK